MRKGFYIFTLVSYFSVCPIANAEEAPTNKPTKRTQKVLKVLDRMGIADPRLSSLVETVEANTRNGYIFLAQERVADGNLALRYDTGGLKLRQLELAYTPDDSHYEVRANSRGIMLHYHYEFD